MVHSKQPILIGLDWGTTSLRAYSLGANGVVLDVLSSAAGILANHETGFLGTFHTIVGPWLSEFGPLPVIASGMITSRNGWVETPYLLPAAGSDDFAQALHVIELDEGVNIHFVTGLSCTDNSGNPDIMRGEETQIIGSLHGNEAGWDGAAQFLLPGTHSKWVDVSSGSIQAFETYMTGEMFSALLNHTILGKLTDPGVTTSTEIFAAAVKQSLQSDGSVLHRIFSARTLPLLDRLNGKDVADHLSGILIGEEVRAARARMSASFSGPIVIVGRSDLSEKYATALKIAGLEYQFAAPDAAARGHYHIAKARGLI